MRIISFMAAVFIGLMMVSCGNDQSSRTESSDISGNSFPVPAIDYQPRHYVCYKATGKLNYKGKNSEIARYSYREITRKYSVLMNSVVEASHEDL